jgi:hypothetical protein
MSDDSMTDYAMADALLERAAKGDADAQSELSLLAVGMTDRGTVGVIAGLASAEIFARMACISGETLARRKRLGAILYLQSKYARELGDAKEAQNYQVQAIVHATKLADEGDEESAALVSALASEMTPNVLAIAKAALGENTTH